MISKTDLLAHLDTALAGLKDFQRASVEALRVGFEERDRPSMLLADEVGLGKTIVAKGLIAALLKQRLEEGKRRPLKVTYICSNQVIARENIRKLNPFPRELGMKDPITRISYLAYDFPAKTKGEQQGLLELSTLTPSTSFDLSQSNGNKWERRAIYSVLCSNKKLLNRKDGLQWILRGEVQKMDDYKRQLDQALGWRLREGLSDKYISLLKNTPLPMDAHEVYEELRARQEHSIYAVLCAFSKIIDGRNVARLRAARWKLTGVLRKLLVDCCLEYLDADLFILDEFQRFRDLIDESSVENEQAQIAQKVFQQKKGSRILLVSATPFKAFTGADDLERGEDHFKDFKKVLGFLLKNDPREQERYEEHRQSLYRQILDLRSGETNDVSSHHRDEVEGILRSVICRTERQNVAVSGDMLVRDIWKEPEHAISFGPGDIEHFRITDRLARVLELVGYSAIQPMEYCKSALFPLSFMDRYQLKEKLRQHDSEPLVREALGHSGGAWIPDKQIQRYEFTITGKGKRPANARLSSLVEHAVGENGHRLLWVPPCLPYYPLRGAFAESDGFSKTLVFSSWIMVPRMIASLVSYEIERRTIGNSKTVHDQETPEARRYFSQQEGKHRHPTPQLTYSMRTEESRSMPANMSNYTLLYPCQTLATLVDPVLNVREGATYSDIKAAAARQIQAKLREAGVREIEASGAGSDRWYWAALLLLDRAGSESYQAADSWLADLEEERNRVSASPAEKTRQDRARGLHLLHLRSCLNDPAKADLGRMPSDLPQVLAEIALGSPAILALRSLQRYFPHAEKKLLLKWAEEIASEFESLFNKPESIAAVRLSEKQDIYWRMVAGYCSSGCLQSVLDEYLHQLVEQRTADGEAIDQLKQSVNLNVANINVDSLGSFFKGSPLKMRCHYAVEFGSQRIETDEGNKRASSVRQIFNSPFRPFVLATTSIGQEGLDFHSYCRRIVHWNLPGNPIDLEQREGRINRYKGLVIRQQVAGKYREHLKTRPFTPADDVWESLFKIADEEERVPAGKSQLIPFWYVTPEGRAMIERVIPLYPFSADRGRLERILRTLAIYRLAFGQPRQAELVEHLLGRNFSAQELESIQSNLLINLSPSARNCA